MSQYPDSTNTYEDNWETNDTAKWTEGNFSPNNPKPVNQLPNYLENQPNYPSNQLNRFGNQPSYGSGYPQNPSNLPVSPTQPFPEITITQDDILFMRKVRTDCLLYRVLPITAASYGGLFMYSKIKNAPFSVGRFLAVGLASFVVSISSYRGKFLTAVRESPVDTPYLRAIRSKLNIAQVVGRDEFATSFGDNSTKWVDGGLINEQDYSSKLNSNLNTDFTSDYSNQPVDSVNRDFAQSNQLASYEELRARNRGYIK